MVYTWHILMYDERRWWQLTYIGVYPYTYYETTFLDGVHVYPFCLYPLSIIQPSGSCSFSYLNNKLLRYNLDKQINNGIIKIFARSYNILRISSGIGCIFI